MQHTAPRWWQTGVVYQIYPRSFADASGGGTGDLAGITGHLDYLAWLGVDAIWISPFYPSPMADFGYDVSDYTDVDPLFGSLADFDVLLDAAHDRGIRVLIDYVPNHTSDQHPWFIESRSSRDNPRRGWYVWRDAKPDGSPPNNWISMFNGPAWGWDEATGQFYLHTFLAEQPDLNWRNPDTRAAMFDVARFWLDRGVDGLRIDVAPMVMKDPQLRDNPPNPEPGREHSRLGSWLTQLHLHDHAHPDMHELYRSFRAIVDSYPGDRVSIGELHHPDFDTWARYYGERQDEIHVPFNFHVLNSPWRDDAVRRAVEGVQGALPPGAWASWVLGNHDQPRFASPMRAGRDQARVGMLLLLTLRGTPTIYYGDEIGMVDVPVETEDSRDPLERREPGRGRDPERSPMQWDASPNAGFTAPEAVPWLPLAPDADRVNVAAQAEDPGSLLALTRDLLRLRREHPVLHTGDFERFGPTPDGTFAFRRASTDGRLTVALNLTAVPRSVPGAGPGRVLIGTHRDREGDRVDETLDLRSNEHWWWITRSEPDSACADWARRQWSAKREAGVCALPDHSVHIGREGCASISRDAGGSVAVPADVAAFGVIDGQPAPLVKQWRSDGHTASAVDTCFGCHGMSVSLPSPPVKDTGQCGTQPRAWSKGGGPQGVATCLPEMRCSPTSSQGDQTTSGAGRPGPRACFAQPREGTWPEGGGPVDVAARQSQ